MTDRAKSGIQKFFPGDSDDRLDRIVYQALCSVCGVSTIFTDEQAASLYLKRHRCPGAGSIKRMYAMDIAMMHAAATALEETRRAVCAVEQRRHERIEALLA